MAKQGSATAAPGRSSVDAAVSKVAEEMGLEAAAMPGKAAAAAEAPVTINKSVPVPAMKSVYQIMQDLGLSTDSAADQEFIGDAKSLGEMMLRWLTNVEALQNSETWKLLPRHHRTALKAVGVFCRDLLGLRGAAGDFNTMKEYFADLRGIRNIIPVAQDRTTLARFVKKHGVTVENLKRVFEAMSDQG